MKAECCVCKRVNEQGKWSRTSGDAQRDVTYTYCPECLQRVTAAMRAEVHAAKRAEVRVASSV